MAASEPMFTTDIVADYGELADAPSRLSAKCEVLYGTEGRNADQYFCIYPTGVIVTGVTVCHPLIQEGRQLMNHGCLNPDDKIQVVLENDASWSLSDRGQRAKVPKFKDHALCTIKVGEHTFTINHPFRTALLNFNSRLKDQPELLIERPHWEGHVAVLSAEDRIIGKMKRQLATVAQYSELRDISEYELVV